MLIGGGNPPTNHPDQPSSLPTVNCDKKKHLLLAVPKVPSTESEVTTQNRSHDIFAKGVLTEMVKSDPRKGYGSPKSEGVWPGLIASAADRKTPFVLQRAAFSYCRVAHVLQTSDADNRGGLSVDTAVACQATEINWVGTTCELPASNRYTKPAY